MLRTTTLSLAMRVCALAVPILQQSVAQASAVPEYHNLEAANAAKLTISSKLLRPATVINSGAQ